MTEQLKSGLWYRCRDFVTEQSVGEWDDKTIVEDTEKLVAFVNRERADMLEAAENARKVIHNFIEAHGDSGAGLIIRQLDAAISKATGAQ